MGWVLHATICLNKTVVCKWSCCYTSKRKVLRKQVIGDKYEQEVVKVEDANGIKFGEVI